MDIYNYVSDDINIVKEFFVLKKGFFGMVSLISGIVISFSFIACNDNLDKNQVIIPFEYHGSWTEGIYECIITGDSIKWISNNTQGYIVARVDSISIITNKNKSMKNEFPKGYNFIGKIIEVNGNITGLGKFTVGDNFSEYYFFNTAKDKFNFNDGGGPGTVIYTKQ